MFILNVLHACALMRGGRRNGERYFQTCGLAGHGGFRRRAGLAYPHGAAAIAWRNLFNPFAADRFDLPPLAGLTDAAGVQIPGFSAADIADKTVFLNAFASWCPQCREEHQALVDFARSGATIYGVASADDPANTLKYLRDVRQSLCAARR